MSKKDTKYALLKDIQNQKLDHVGFEIKHKKDGVAREINYLRNPTGITGCSWSGSEHEILYNLICELSNQLTHQYLSDSVKECNSYEEQNLSLIKRNPDFTVDWNDKERFLKEHCNIVEIVKIPVTSGVAVLLIRGQKNNDESK